MSIIKLKIFPVYFLLLLASHAIAQVYPPDVQYIPVPVLPLIRPSYLNVITDPSFGTGIIRITDSTVFSESNVRHHYSKDQPWNADQTLIKIDGDRLLDGQTFQYLRTIYMPSEVVWSSLDPNKLFGITTNGNQFMSIDATTGVQTILHTFTGYNNIYMGPWEGNVSIDDSIVVFVTSTGSGGDIIVYDIANDNIVSSASIASLGYLGTIDWASISQSGNYVVINGRGSSNDAVKSFDRNLNYIATLFTVGEHGDMGYDAYGNEVFIQVCSSSYRMARLSNGQVTSLVPTNQCGHISTRNINRPGWCYSTTNNPNSDVLAIKLDTSGIVERYTHHRSSEISYDAEPHGVPSPDGKLMMFANDWNGTSEINSYITGMMPLLGIVESNISNRNHFFIYPNPANETLTIKFDYNSNQKRQFQIFNSMGMLLKEVSVTRSSQINIEDLSSGLYFVHPINDFSPAIKLIKQ